VSLKKYKYQGKAAVVTVNSKEETSHDFWLDFFQEFNLGTKKKMEQELSPKCEDTI
jgi:hypothetical protein